ncbi:MAG: tetratricopeptide repeat protein [Acidobacteriota bacterium]
MRKLRFAGLLLSVAVLAPVPSRAQDWRGRGRIDGWVRNEKGEPVPDAAVQMTREKDSTGPKAKTNKSGYWAIMGIAGGAWNMDVSAAGFQTRKMSMSLSEAARTPPVDVQLQAASGTAPSAGVAAGSGADAKNAGEELRKAIEKGNELLGQKQFATARAEYEKALAGVPDNPAILKGIAQTYHGERNTAKTIETLRRVAALDPADTEARVLLASLLLESGQLDEGQKTLDQLPPGAVKDPAVYLNLGILLMNKNNPAQAQTFFTRAIETDPAQADAYYYRGLSYMNAKKNAEAKADFKKYLELSPQGPEAKEVREILQALK